MRSPLLLSLLAGPFGASLAGWTAEPAAEPPPPLGIIADLTDGSRLVGEPQVKTFRFRSEMLGEIEIPVILLRTIQWSAPQSNAKIRTSNGDTVEAVLTASELALKTASGEIRIPVAQLRQIRFQSSARVPDLCEGLVARWSGEDNPRDSAGEHHGELLFGADYAPGKVGRAFRFEVNRARVHVPDAKDFQFPGSFTVEGWLRVTELPPAGGAGMFCNHGDNRAGLDMWNFAIQPDGRVSCHSYSTENEEVALFAPIKTGEWFHLAYVFDVEAGQATLYINGVVADEKKTKMRPIQVLDGSPDAGIGLGNHCGRTHDWSYKGMIDEWGVYSRPLTPEDIQALVDAGQAGQRVVPATP